MIVGSKESHLTLAGGTHATPRCIMFRRIALLVCRLPAALPPPLSTPLTSLPNKEFSSKNCAPWQSLKKRLRISALLSEGYDCQPLSSPNYPSALNGLRFQKKTTTKKKTCLLPSATKLEIEKKAKK